MQFNGLAGAFILTGTMSLTACNPWFDRAVPTIDGRTSGPQIVSSPQSCPAKELQYLVGQPRTVLQTMRFGGEVRFEEPGQAYTEEFSPTRTRIIIGANGKITQIICG